MLMDISQWSYHRQRKWFGLLLGRLYALDQHLLSEYCLIQRKRRRCHIWLTPRPQSILLVNFHFQLQTKSHFRIVEGLGWSLRLFLFAGSCCRRIWQIQLRFSFITDPIMILDAILTHRSVDLKALRQL